MHTTVNMYRELVMSVLAPRPSAIDRLDHSAPVSSRQGKTPFSTRRVPAWLACAPEVASCSVPDSPVSEAHQQLIERGLAGDESAIESLVNLLTPVIQARAARALLRHPRRARRAIEEEVADLTQEVFLELFRQDGRVLRAWQPLAGASLPTFVGIIAQRRVISRLRSGRQSPYQDHPHAPEELEGHENAALESHERAVESRQELGRLLDEFREALTPKGLDMFYRLHVSSEPVEQICAETGLKPAAVYQWQTRLRQMARKARSALLGDGSARDEQRARTR